jgi:small-conductance mechanosensitive channel
VSHTIGRLDLVQAEMEEMRDHKSLLLSIFKAVVATGFFAGITWLLARNRRRAEGRLIRFTADGAQHLKSPTLRVLGAQNLVSILRGSMTLIFWAGAIVTGYVWLEYMLRLFPHTRPFGELLGLRFLEVLGRFGQGTLHQLPNLGIVIVVWALARFAVTATRRFFAAVVRGKVRSHVFDAATAPITQRLVIFFIWITAVIVAFPYIPGSQTPAFRGISVLAGLMISIGSGSLIGQLVGGLVVVYNRNCRAGEYVRVGEYEGTLIQIGFFSSRLVNTRNEEIVVPNSQLASGVLINYSRRGDSTGVALPVKVSIGYGTPWRQIHALLIEAARRTRGVRREPPPSVLQSNLADFYVEYQLHAVLENPADRVAVLSNMNANIQDAFNEAGVQIMSPHYRTDPPLPVYVPKEKWHEPPAGSSTAV